jgi:hypothetical protein
MAQDVFPFFRATFYRWMQLWPKVCADAARAPHVLAVGDLHVENFGTWRDVEGRLVWGINDFDEVYELPYTIDLVRLAASAHIAIREARLEDRRQRRLRCDPDRLQESLEMGGVPYVLADEHDWLRGMVTGILRDPGSLAEARQPAHLERPRSQERAPRHRAACCRSRDSITGSFIASPASAVWDASATSASRTVPRRASGARSQGAGSFGVRLGLRGKVSERIRYQEALDRSVRDIDPFVRLRGSWIVRRLAPDCSRVELASMPKERDESRLLRAMGFETANVHLGTPRAAKRFCAIWANDPAIGCMKPPPPW